MKVAVNQVQPLRNFPTRTVETSATLLLPTSILSPPTGPKLNISLSPMRLLLGLLRQKTTLSSSPLFYYPPSRRAT